MFRRKPKYKKPVITMSIASKNGYGVTTKPLASFDVNHTAYHILKIEQVCHTWIEPEQFRLEVASVVDHYLNFIFKSEDSSTTIATKHLITIFTRSTK